MRSYQIILMSILLTSLVHTQEQQDEDTTDAREDFQWEKVLESALQDDENSSAAEEVSELEDTPLNLNAISAEELHRIPGISNLLASRIVERRKQKRFTSLDDLLEIDGVTHDLFSFIRQYLKIGRIKKGPTVSCTFTTRMSTEIEERQGYTTGVYPGSSAKILNRLHCSIGKIHSPISSIISEIEVGVLTEKDPGEQSVSNFITYFMGISIPALATHIILGDYQMEGAEGLIFWRASAFGKGSDVLAPARKNGGGIRSHLSSDENSFLRGACASVDLGMVQVQLLYSNKAIHATIDSSGSMTALYKTGLFRTEDEQSKQNASRENLIGCRAVTYPTEGLKIGGSWYRTLFANPYLLTGGNGERAAELSIRGIDVSYTVRTLDLFSECSMDRGNALAVIAGVTYEPDAALAFTIVARNYPPAFQSIHGNAFGENSGAVQNENGVYIGIRTQLTSGLCGSMYYDQFGHPQPTFRLPAPSHGNDFLALAEYSLTEQFKLAFRFKRKDSPDAISVNDVYGRSEKQIVSRIQKNYRLTSEFSSSPLLRLSSRVEWVNVHYEGLQFAGLQAAELQAAEQGVLVSQAVTWNVFHKLSVQARAAFFETESFDSSLYEFEDEVPGAYSNPALYGRGMRWYFILRYDVSSKIKFAAKYVQTVKEGVRSMGTGNDEIQGNSQSGVSMQVEVRF
jgi:DNA uptake protein ComE-like DNA-binding protein